MKRLLAMLILSVLLVSCGEYVPEENKVDIKNEIKIQQYKFCSRPKFRKRSETVWLSKRAASKRLPPRGLQWKEKSARKWLH